MGEQLLFFCGCGDGSCSGCQEIRELNEAIKKTSVVTRDSRGNIVGIMSTRTAMGLRRLLKPSEKTQQVGGKNE